MSDFSKIGNFCEEDDDDVWEQIESLNSFDFNRYTEKEFIAAGGVKNVYKVYDSKMQRHIALAELKEDIPEEYCEAFINESSLTASLRHPNIITVHDFGVNEKHLPYMTMELKVGSTLAEIIKDKSLSREELLNIFLKICDAISYSHSQKVLHLDLKPENIQVGEFGEVQVCDWGLSRKVNSEAVTEKISGTPGYMAPEQLKEGDSLDTTTDIFSLGAILYSLITLERPIDGGIETIVNHTRVGDIVAPSIRFPDKNIPKSLDAVICRAMDPEKSERYQTVPALAMEVTKYLNGHSTFAEKAGLLQEMKLFFMRNKQACIISLIAIFILLLGTSVFMYEIQKSKKSTEIALVNLNKAHQDLQKAQMIERKLYEENERAQKRTLKAITERHKIYSKLIDKELKEAFEYMSAPLFYSSPEKYSKLALAVLDSHYKTSNKNKHIKNLLAITLFVTQEFERLSQFKDHSYPALSKIAEKHKATKKNSFGILEENDFLHLLEDINAIPQKQQGLKHRILERAVCYMYDVRKPVFTSYRIVQQLLKSWNSDWDVSNIHYDKEKLILRLTGKRLSKLHATGSHSSGLCFLRFLKIDTLDIRGSGVVSLAGLQELAIRRLDIRDTGVQHLHPHGATKNIHEVYLTRDQLTSEEAQFLPTSVKLIYK